MTKCLEEANKHDVHNIAFPTLGTGGLGFPINKVAKTMICCVKNHSEKYRDSMLKQILFVVFKHGKDCATEFKVCIFIS